MEKDNNQRVADQREVIRDLQQKLSQAQDENEKKSLQLKINVAQAKLEELENQATDEVSTSGATVSEETPQNTKDFHNRVTDEIYEDYVLRDYNTRRFLTASGRPTDRKGAQRYYSREQAAKSVKALKSKGIYAEIDRLDESKSTLTESFIIQDSDSNNKPVYFHYGKYTGYDWGFDKKMATKFPTKETAERMIERMRQEGMIINSMKVVSESVITESSIYIKKGNQYFCNLNGDPVWAPMKDLALPFDSDKEAKEFMKKYGHLFDYYNNVKIVKEGCMAKKFENMTNREIANYIFNHPHTKFASKMKECDDKEIMKAVRDMRKELAAEEAPVTNTSAVATTSGANSMYMKRPEPQELKDDYLKESVDSDIEDILDDVEEMYGAGAKRVLRDEIYHKNYLVTRNSFAQMANALSKKGLLRDFIDAILEKNTRAFDDLAKKAK
jgi:hypothetical protein